MDLDKLVEELENVRDGFQTIIREIETGDNSAVNSLDQGMFNERNRELFLLNAQAMAGKERHNGRPYFVHPATAAYLIHKFPDPSYDSGLAIGFALTHDLVDTALEYDVDEFKIQKGLFGDEFNNEILSAIRLAQPRLYNLWSEDYEALHPEVYWYPAARLYQVNEYGDKNDQIALLAEAFDNMLDVKFFESRTDIESFVTRALFYARNVYNPLPELTEPIEKYAEETIQGHNLNRSRIDNYLNKIDIQYSHIFTETDAGPIERIENHFKIFGHPLPTG